ncbi:MAG TPA: hypothetical protein VFY84_08840 [Jiangellales bacterium]|nr:hypothetical protein [Jiangellales bacterium]
MDFLVDKGERGVVDLHGSTSVWNAKSNSSRFLWCRTAAGELRPH